MNIIITYYTHDVTIDINKVARRCSSHIKISYLLMPLLRGLY